RHLRIFSTLFLLLLFGCYYSGISMFSHTHIVNGTSIVHSHFGDEDGHQHSESQFAIIDILSNFQSEGAVYFYNTAVNISLLTEIPCEYESCLCVAEVIDSYTLRGPPVA
ncbi:MAG: hypothetical protein IIU76_00115, partial [Bacteroidales bacterium]|nr:hypothetical protein [Bacteroidales bacterium]